MVFKSKELRVYTVLYTLYCIYCTSALSTKADIKRHTI